jgi:signal peptidase I
MSRIGTPVTDPKQDSEKDEVNASATPSEPAEEQVPTEPVVDPESPTEDAKEDKKKKKEGNFWKELPILIVIALVLTFVIQTFIARVYVIPSGSMEQTLHGCTGCNNDRILVDEVVYDFKTPQPGDVVVFKAPDNWANTEGTSSTSSSNVFVHWLRQFGSSIGIGKPDEYDLVKRVMAVGGQTIQCCDAQGRVLVNGKPLTEPYVYWPNGSTAKDNIESQTFGPITIPAGDLWVMGDNRTNSYDSRFQGGAGNLAGGVVPVKNVIGKARAVIWPPSRWQGVGDYDAQNAVALPAWTQYAPQGVGMAVAFPVLIAGKKIRGKLKSRMMRRYRK